MRARRLLTLSLIMFVMGPAQAIEGVLLVHRLDGCVCCELWVEHLRDAGVPTDVRVVANMSTVKVQHRVPRDMESCHTAVMESGFVVEGHVPADILLEADALLEAGFIGLAVPGMPAGSPGMENAAARSYPIYAFRADGSYELYQVRAGHTH